MDASHYKDFNLEMKIDGVSSKECKGWNLSKINLNLVNNYLMAQAPRIFLNNGAIILNTLSYIYNIGLDIYINIKQ